MAVKLKVPLFEYNSRACFHNDYLIMYYYNLFDYLEPAVPLFGSTLLCLFTHDDLTGQFWGSFFGGIEEPKRFWQVRARCLMCIF